MPNRPRCLGIEIGGTKLQLGLGRGDGRLVALERRRIDSTEGAEGIRRQILEVLPSFSEAGGETGFDAAGIGFGGPVDAAIGVVTTSNQIEGWDGFPIASWLAEALGLDPSRIALENDADTAALAEGRWGAGVGASTLLYVTVGSGVGGGLLIDGRIYRGAGFGAAEVGQLRLGTNGGTDVDTSSTIESLASGWAIAAAGRLLLEGRLRDGSPTEVLGVFTGDDPTQVDAALVSEAAKLGDIGARIVLDRAAGALGRGLGLAATLLGPSRIVLGGGVSQIEPELWGDHVRRAFDAWVFPQFRGRVSIRSAALGEAVVVIGAVALAADRLEAPSE